MISVEVKECMGRQFCGVIHVKIVHEAALLQNFDMMFPTQVLFVIVGSSS